MRISNQRDLIQRFTESHPEIGNVRNVLMTDLQAYENAVCQEKDMISQKEVKIAGDTHTEREKGVFGGDSRYYTEGHNRSSVKKLT